MVPPATRLFVKLLGSSSYCSYRALKTSTATVLGATQAIKQRSFIRQYCSKTSISDDTSKASTKPDLAYKQITINEDFNLARDAVMPVALQDENKKCLIFVNDNGERTEYTYKDLYKSTVELATGLDQTPHGMPKLAIVILPKIYEWWVVNLCGSWGGMTICPGTTQMSISDIRYRFLASDADAIICSPDFVDKFERAGLHHIKNDMLQIVVGEKPHKMKLGWMSYESLIDDGYASVFELVDCAKLNPEDNCQLFFTSGTTGKPKMVPQTHLNYAKGLAIMARHWLDLTPDDLLCNVSDTGWAKAAWSSLYAPLLCQSTLFVNQAEKFSSRSLLESLASEPITVLCAPPTVYRMMVQENLEQYKFRSLRHCVSAGEPLNPEVLRSWKEQTGLNIYEGYGQSETTLLCANTKGMKIKPGSMGRPAPGYDLKIINEQFEELPVHEEGYIAVKVKHREEKKSLLSVFKGYLGAPKRTADSFKDDYYLTGDRGHVDEDGYFWFKARDDDVIISAGYRIGPFEVESALVEHPDVVEAAVVGVSHKIRGEIVKAFVILSEQMAKSLAGNMEKQEEFIVTLQNHVKQVTAPYKYPRQIVFVTELPKTISGKIKRFELRNPGASIKLLE